MSPHHFSILPIDEYIHCQYAAPPEEQRHYTIIWIKQGHGSCFIDLHRTPVSHDTVHFLRPGITCYFEPGCAVTGYIVQFDPETLYRLEINFVNRLIRCSQPVAFPANRTGPAKVTVKLEGIMEMLYTEYNHSGLQQHQLLSGWLTILLLYVADLFPEADPNAGFSGPSQLTARFYALLEKDFQVKKAVVDYAEALHVAPDHLTCIIKRVSGYPASHHIKQRVLLEAKRLALYSDKSMKEIAYWLGFYEPAHFSKFFKANCGKTFRDYKKAHAGSLFPPAVIQ